MIPFIIFITGLSLVSTGVIAYVENESILAVLITSRDHAASVDLHGLDSSGNAISVSAEKATVVLTPGEKLQVPFYYQGEQFGTIHISSVDIDVNVYQGDAEDELRLGAGHYIASMFPGQNGNIVVASHRTTYFRNFENLKTGDLVEFETTYGHFTYEVREIKILDKDFYAPAKPTDKEQLTLYTCYPFTYIGNAPSRFFVLCDLIGSELNT